MPDTNAVFLSHVLSELTPAYGGGQGLAVQPATRISGGATANSDVWTLPNHLGTHIDFPLHFYDEGAGAHEYDAGFWKFTQPQIVDVPLQAGGLVETKHVQGILREGTDFLLIRTGFERHRAGSLYWENNPGISPELALWLRMKAGSLRVLGIDAISITCRTRRPEGKKAHEIFLDPRGNGSPILLAEDMCLAHAPEKLSSVLVAPLRVLGANGTPCTIVGFTA